MSIMEAQSIAQNAPTDERLCALARSGDRDAEETLVKRYFQLAVSYTHLTLPTIYSV